MQSEKKHPHCVRSRSSARAALQAHTKDVHGANTVTKDFLVLSQPFIHEGMLLSSAKTGRRVYIHHLSELPLSEVFTTRIGNQLQRINKARPHCAALLRRAAPCCAAPCCAAPRRVARPR